MYFDSHNKRDNRLSKWITKLLFLAQGIVARIKGKNVIIVNPWVKYRYGRLTHSNWGDDINMFFLASITDARFLPSAYYPVRGLNLLKNRFTHYLIGSCFHMISGSNSLVWGTGILSIDYPPSIIPEHVCAVRGPLTRDILLNMHVDCPKIYGDPALLLPYYYPCSRKEKKYKIGIIPHYVDYFRPELDSYKNDESILVIKMSGYKNWKDIIDQVTNCEVIASSSLHGLIVAYAYGIPFTWVEIKEPIVGDEKRRFKFHDFFLSQGFDIEHPYTIDNTSTLDCIVEQAKCYKSSYSIVPLVKSCPFKLKAPKVPFV